MKRALFALSAALFLLTVANKAAAQSSLSGPNDLVIINPDNGALSVNVDALRSLYNIPQDTANVAESSFSPYELKAPIYNDEKPLFRVSVKIDTIKAGKKSPNSKPDTRKRYYITIPDSLLGRDLLAITRLTNIPAGFAFNSHQDMAEGTYKFCLSPDKKSIQLRQLAQYFATKPGDAVNKSVDISNAEAIVYNLKVESHSSKDYTIEITDLLMQDKLMGIHPNLKKAHSLRSIDPNRSSVTSIHAYPQNIEIRTSLTYSSISSRIPAAEGCVTFGLNTSFILLPGEPMARRYADPRVGFGALKVASFTDNEQKVGSVNYITRWRLEPKSKSDSALQAQGQAIEPQKAIVWYIDPAMPLEWRKYIKEGVAEWEKPFEKAGWKNAIICKEWPTNDSLISLEDSRYNVIRYIPNDAKIVYGTNRAWDYRSGEFLNAAIFFHHGMINANRVQYVGDCGAVDPDCHVAKLPEHLLGAIIRFRIAQAVATTLGLQPNLLASALVPTDSLRSQSFVAKYSLAPSITDGLPYNYVAQPGDGLTYNELIPRVSDGDEWTVEWGYKTLPFSTPEEEQFYLLDYTTNHLAANPRHEFSTATSINDPLCKEGDLGDDQVAAVKYGMRNLERITPYIISWAETNRDLHNDYKNQNYNYSQIQANIVRYYSILGNNLSGMCYRPKPSVAQGKVYYHNDYKYLSNVLDALIDVFGTQITWDTSDRHHLFEWPLPERVGYAYAQYVPGCLNPVSFKLLNPNMPRTELAQRVYDRCLRDIKEFKDPDLFNKRMQNLFVYNLLLNLSEKTQNIVEHEQVIVARMFAKKAQADIKAALQKTTNASTRQHYEMLLMQIEQSLSI